MYGSSGPQLSSALAWPGSYGPMVCVWRRIGHSDVWLRSVEVKRGAEAELCRDATYLGQQP